MLASAYNIVRPFTYFYKILKFAFASMMLFSNNITNRLKAVCRFCGDTDKSHKRPHISFLEGLPVELLQFIASYLPLSAAASFALSSKCISYVVGRQYWYHLRSQPLEYEIFLGFLEKDMNRHWLCHQCLIFHLKPKLHPTLKYGLAHPAWKCTQCEYDISSPNASPYTYPGIEWISHLMVHMAMNCHFFGSEHGEPLDIFSGPSHTDSFQDGRGEIYTEACIVDNELFLRCQHLVAIPSSKDFGYIRPHIICPHIRSLDPENPMAPIIKCLLSHRNTVSCEKCKGLRQCRSCNTEFNIQISRFGATGHVLEITYWKNLGAGRSPDDPKWAQHPRIPRGSCSHAAKFLPGSVQSAFESGNNNNIQISICNLKGNKPLSRFKRLLGWLCVAFGWCCIVQVGE